MQLIATLITADRLAVKYCVFTKGDSFYLTVSYFVFPRLRIFSTFKDRITNSANNNILEFLAFNHLSRSILYNFVLFLPIRSVSREKKTDQLGTRNRRYIFHNAHEYLSRTNPKTCHDL